MSPTDRRMTRRPAEDRSRVLERRLVDELTKVRLAIDVLEETRAELARRLRRVRAAGERATAA